MSSFGANSIFRDIGNSVANMLDNSNQFGRVYSILLTDDQKDADAMKVPVGSIGAIQFKFLVKGVEDANSITQTAYPIDARNRAFPVKNEVVEILTGPSNKVQDAETNNLPVYYYRAVVDMWGASEHNARPNSQFNTSKEQVTGEFIEKGDISRMKHLPGDYVIEGRFGNGIRFGSSNSKTKVSSPWSGPDGSPLVIISNGRKKGKLSFEDINKDGSSMYILSDQKIAFEPASLNFESYNVTMTAVQSSQVVKPDPVKATAPVPVAAVPPVEPVVVETAVTASVIQEPLKVDEVEALPEQESTEGFQEFEAIIIGNTRLSSGLSYKPEYEINASTSIVRGTERLAIGTFKPSTRGEFGKLPFKNFMRTPKTLEDFANTLNSLKNKALINKNLARSVLAIAINEQGGTNGFNNNFFGIHSDIGSFKRSGIFSNSKPNYQVVAREGGTNKMRAYLGFNTFEDAILYIADILNEKGFSDLTYGPEEDNKFTRLYIDRWWSPVNKNVSADIFSNKKQGYVRAKKLIP